MEMETAAIYGLSKLLGHQALSMNAIIATDLRVPSARIQVKP